MLKPSGDSCWEGGPHKISYHIYSNLAFPVGCVREILLTPVKPANHQSNCVFVGTPRNLHPRIVLCSTEEGTASRACTISSFSASN